VRVDENAVGKLVRTFKKSYKRLDGLVNCAGELSLAFFPTVARSGFADFVDSLMLGVNLPPRESSSIDQAYFDTTMDTNLKGSWAFCKHFGIAAKKDLGNDQVDPPEGGYSIVYVYASFSAVRDLIADESFQEYRNIGSNASLMGIEYTSIYVRPNPS